MENGLLFSGYLHYLKNKNLPADKYPYVPVKVSAAIYPEKYDEILLN